MVQAPRNLADIVRKGGSLRAECRECGHVAIFAAGEIEAYWRRKRWTTEWPYFARHLKCGCGARNPRISWLSSTPPDHDPLPPRPRFTRSPMPKGEAEETNVVPMRKRRAA